MKRIGNFLWKVAIIATITSQISANYAHAGKVDVTVDRNEISLDESVALKIEIESDMNEANDIDPKVDAPDFDLVNQFQRSSTQAFYENGRFSAKTVQSLTKILSPKKAGALQIKKVTVKLGSKIESFGPIAITVTSSGGGTPPSKGFSGSGAGLRGAKNTKNRDLFLRAEVDKATLYKNEQCVVSYYLYKRVPVLRLETPTKWPSLGSFVKEDMDVPIIKGLQPPEQVIVEGISYERTLLARYAAYPLKEGKVEIDPIEIPMVYEARSQANRDEEEEWDPFGSFFNRLNQGRAQTTRLRSETLHIQVKSLPEAGKNEAFSGAVGQYEVVANASKASLKTGEAVSILFQITGRGNLSSVEEPKPQWPEGIESFETKSSIKSRGGGYSEKTFEFLLIPRKPGTIEFAPFQFHYFDPQKDSYQVRETAPIKIEVTGAAIQKEEKRETAPEDQSSGDSPRHRVLEDLSVETMKTVGLYSALIAAAAILLFALRRLFKWIKKRTKSAEEIRKLREKEWNQERVRLEQFAKNASNFSGPDTNKALMKAYDDLVSYIWTGLEIQTGILVRSVSRVELDHQFREGAIKPESIEFWQKIVGIIEYAESVRFTINAGFVNVSEARTKLETLIAEATVGITKIVKNSS